jgi:AmmeMemoRadiSam system protein B
MEFRSDARPSPIAGTWYLGDPIKLARQIDSFIDAAKLTENDFNGKVVGLLAPHAGHRYSGRTAAYAYKTVRGKPRDLVVILSPFHPFFSGEFLTTSHSAYQTPLGDLPVAKKELQSLDDLLNKRGLKITQISNDEEHSLEIQLPFLQRAWESNFELLPLMVRSQNPKNLNFFADALYEVVKGRDFLLIASSDLSHFYPLQTAEALDAEMLNRVKSFDPLSVLSAESEGSAFACGSSAIAAMLWTSKLAGADKVEILNYSTSADATGDPSSVVGYGTAVIYKSIKK